MKLAIFLAGQIFKIFDQIFLYGFVANFMLNSKMYSCLDWFSLDGKLWAYLWYMVWRLRLPLTLLTWKKSFDSKRPLLTTLVFYVITRYGTQRASFIGAQLWDSLPALVRSADTLDSFTRQVRQLESLHCKCRLCAS